MHLIHGEYLFAAAIARGPAVGAVDAFVLLALIGCTFLAVVKLADAEALLVAGEQEGVDAAAFRHVWILHQFDCPVLQLFCVDLFILVAVVELLPLDTLHLPAVSGESLLGPTR